MVRGAYRGDNCASHEKAVRLYCGYLGAKKGGAHLPGVLAEVLEGIRAERAAKPMSPKSAEQLSAVSGVMEEDMRELGLREIENPLLRIVTLALPVVPELNVTDMGLVDVLKKRSLRCWPSSLPASITPSLWRAQGVFLLRKQRKGIILVILSAVVFGLDLLFAKQVFAGGGDA